MKAQYTYYDLQKLFSKKHRIPPAENYTRNVEVVYRCPYIPDCPGNYNCFIIATPNPLEQDVILNLNCKLCNEKICILRSPADSDAFQSGRYAEHNGRSKTLDFIV